MCGAGKKKPTRLAVFLSAFVLPGTGQCVQKRWFAAAFYGIGFLVTLGGLLLFSGRLLAVYYDIWEAEGAGDAEMAELKACFWRLLVVFAASMILYVVNILDAHRAYRRELATWLSEERLKRLGDSSGVPVPAPGANTGSVSR